MSELDMKDVQYVPLFHGLFGMKSDDCGWEKDIKNMIFTPRLRE